jgi:hypothetical protein
MQRGNNDGYVRVVDAAGKLRLEGPFVPNFGGIAWSPKGDEVWWGGIRATSLDGKTRAVWSSPSAYIQDIARDGGTVLFADGTGRREIVGFPAGGAAPRNLTELNWSFPVDISADGSRVMFNEQQRAAAVYIRGLDGSPAVRIGEARPPGSPMGAGR